MNKEGGTLSGKAGKCLKEISVFVLGLEGWVKFSKDVYRHLGMTELWRLCNQRLVRYGLEDKAFSLEGMEDTARKVNRNQVCVI